MGPMNKTLQILQYCTGLVAVAAFFAADVYGWELSTMTAGALGGLIGLVTTRPSDSKMLQKMMEKMKDMMPAKKEE